MTRRKDLTKLTAEEAFEYVKNKREGDAVRSKKYFDETDKNDPEKYAHYLERCRRNNTKQRLKKKNNIEIQV